MFRFTPHRGADGVINRWQLFCKHPAHNREGQGKCTKTKSNAVVGDDVCLKLLKQYALEGINAPSKKKHKEKWAALEGGDMSSLPSEEQLDRDLLVDFPSDHDAPV